MNALYVYVLYSPTHDIFYKGQTSDLDERLKRHNQGLEKSTKKYLPWLLIWKTRKDSRSEAMVLEKKLKNLSRQRLINFLKKNRKELVDESSYLKLIH
ncbi:GIY-YIG nuclease family protein [Mangrovivirga sp. M17]|uniref:GIY-YIG nuclease family protein n=1 Tax=Mangrovivirga halotolerans TaxID=2993936 RepID=A0ABT3RS15_9BACT|nr:GIY-YIG nuclease family protein [Mangrovivirga halotolerans]MCX2743965.1 GIY-YIG nuclease family protein [Mangrovivirga halotolerans]